MEACLGSQKIRQEIPIVDLTDLSTRKGDPYKQFKTKEIEIKEHKVERDINHSNCNIKERKVKAKVNSR